MLDRTECEHLIYTLPAEYPSIRMSTLVLAPPGMDTARLTGLLTFGDDLVLCAYELLDFQQGLIAAYRYEVSRCLPPFTETPLPDSSVYCRARYPEKQTLYWYDSWPHPDDQTLAETFPHHKHASPDSRRRRVPAPELSFTQPNLPFLVQEIELLLGS
jgi:hypothetical protein